MSAWSLCDWIYLRCGERRFVPKVAVSNCSKQQLYSITSSARASIPCSEGEALGTLTEKLNLRRAEPDEVLRRDGNRPIDAEDSNLEFVSRLDRIRQHHSIGHVEALDGGGAGIATAARHLAVDPDFRVIVDIRREHGFCVGRFEIADLRWYRQHRSVPDERHFAPATSGGETRGLDHRP